ncbi:T9SS type A sorting domain-containing protein [Kaistella palustris]|uniref:T9SS type A sorting domain-containing protein n=1 Tax=Kaistella palustris TaxID=493376 RepID=UPI000483C884|nr:T9SS type A sorting domain-containing protein [Kaistella palustris]
MRTIFFFIFTFLFFCHSHGQNVNIPDINFKNKLIGEGVDINGDGEIQETEAHAVVTELSLNDAHISDLTGIKSFTNLKNLYCGRNNLTTVDVNGMSNLEHIYLGENQLDTVNITGCNALKYAAFQHNNLSSINLTDLISLQYLNLDDNIFSSLLINNLLSLKIFSFMDNGIGATLNFNALPLLETIYANNSKLSSINVAGLQAMKVLNASNNQIQTISFQDGLLQNLQFLSVVNNPIQFICKDTFDVLPDTAPIPQLTALCILSANGINMQKPKSLISSNPVQDYLILNQAVEKIELFNAEGKSLLKINNNKNPEINVSSLPAGMYLLTTEKGNVKFIKN